MMKMILFRIYIVSQMNKKLITVIGLGYIVSTLLLYQMNMITFMDMILIKK